MRRPWYRRNPALYERLKSDIQAEFPDLNFFENGDRITIRGSFPVRHDGEVLDRFSIEVELPADRPDSIPPTRELGGRIPQSPDFHISHDGTICALLPDERWRVFPEGSSVLDFLKVPLHNFFLRHCLVEAGESWPHGERGHGVEGIIEYYSELVGTEDHAAIARYLDVLSKREFKGHWPCPCGSGSRLRKCHGNLIRDLRRKISPPIARRSRDAVRGR